METLKNNIIAELAAIGIVISGPNCMAASYPQLIENAIDTVRELGADFYLANSTTGSAINNIIFKLA